MRSTLRRLALAALLVTLAAGCNSKSKPDYQLGLTGPINSNNPNPTNPTVSTTTLPDGTVGQAYAATLAAANGTAPYRWSITTGALPAGLTLDMLSGAISGTPTAVGLASFTARVTDDVGKTADQALSINVVQGGPGPGSWADLAQPRLPTPLAGFAIASVADKVYLFGGLTDVGLSNRILMFDPATNMVTQEPPLLPTARAYLAATAIGTKIYICGGSDANAVLPDLLIYDTVAKTLTPGPLMPGDRDSVTCAAVGTDLFVFGGADIDMNTFMFIPTTNVWKFSTTSNTWSTLQTVLPQRNQWATALAAGGKIYLVGGSDFELDLIGQTQTTVANYSTTYEFDPATSALTPKAPLPAATKCQGGDVINGRLYLVGGERTTGLHNNAALFADPVKDTYSYDPATDTWSTLTQFQTNVPGQGPFGGRALVGAATANGKLYMFGGYTLPQPNMTVPPPPTTQGITDGIAEFTP